MRSYRQEKSARSSPAPATTGMHTLFFRALLRAFALAASSTALSAQLTIHGSEQLAQLAQYTRSVLHGQSATTSYDLFHMVVAHLRLGQLHDARALLTQHQGSKRPELILAAFATLQRTTGANRLAPAQRRSLERRLKTSEQQPFSNFHEAALQIHGRYCLAQLDNDARRSHHERIATTRLLALESETWQPGRGHYRPTPCHGRLLVPAPADASLLQPLTYGMLLASGDRLAQHLTNTLAAARSDSKLRWQSNQPSNKVASLLLTAAAQIADHTATSEAYAAVIKQRAEDPGTAARNLNAALQAITGVRLAAGAGQNPRWLRLAPWLPDGVDRIDLRGIQILEHELAVSIQRLQAPLGLRTSVNLQRGAPRGLQLVIGNRWKQFVTTASTKHPFECDLLDAKEASQKTLPTNPKTDHDTLHQLGGHRW